MSAEGEQRYAALVRAAAGTVVGLDFDGTLSPIVDDPAARPIHPDARDVLVDLAAQVAAIAVITGRPARQALDLGGLEEVGNAIGDAGKELFLFGQYGNERWTSTNRRIVSPAAAGRPGRRSSASCRGCCAGPTPPTRTSRTRASPSPCTPVGWPTPRRRSSDCCRCSRSSPASNDLVVEPGRSVIEVRSPGIDKGVVVERLAEELEIGGFLFAGDDLGDLEAFEAVDVAGRARAADAAGLLGLRRGERAAPAGPTSSSTGPRASSTCCVSSPPTPGTPRA